MRNGAACLAKQGEKRVLALDAAGRALIVIDCDDETCVVVGVPAKRGDNLLHAGLS